MIFFNRLNIILSFLELNPFWFTVMKIYWDQTHWLQKNDEKQLVATEKTGREVNTENPEHMLKFCEENADESHNIK